MSAKVKETTLVKAAWLARDRAYAPYSSFKVGAALENDRGQLFTGCNVEIANFGCSVCAERVAIQKAVSEGALQSGGLVKIAVAAKSDKPSAPCGSCRQVIEEFANEDTVILISNEPGKIAGRYTHADLLPHSFNRSHFLPEA